MNVSDMINVMKTLGIGQVYSDDETNQIFLTFLNLANDQLYSETANINSGIFVIDPLITSNINENSIELSEIPFSISKVYPIGKTKELKGKSVLDFSDYQFENTSPGDPIFYTNIGKDISFWPFVNDISYNFKVIYTPERSELILETPESEIPYPVSYHRVLVDGALYYLFQDESGFKNPRKENAAMERWDKGRADLKSYFYGSNNMLIRTFENA